MSQPHETPGYTPAPGSTPPGYPPAPGTAPAAGPAPTPESATGMPVAAQDTRPAAPAATPAGTEPAEPTRPPAGFDERGRVRRTRSSQSWIALLVAAILLILLIIFIAQNTRDVTIHFFGFAGAFPVGLALLIAAVAGVVIAGALGTMRILQLRKALKRNNPRQKQSGHPHG